MVELAHPVDDDILSTDSVYVPDGQFYPQGGDLPRGPSLCPWQFFTR